MPSVDINWWAILVAVLVNMVVGFIWYSKPLFANSWSKLTGRKPEEMGSGSWGYALTTVGAFLQAYILAHLVVYTAHFYPTYSKVAVGLTTALWVWAGFVLVPQLVNFVFEGRPRKLLYINTGYFLVVLLINGVILAAWH